MTSMTEQIRFDDGAAYERYMGKWSQIAGQTFLDWLAPRSGLRWLDVGCGNGYLANWFAEKGCAVVGIDPSGSGMEQARRAYPRVRFEQLVADEHLLGKLGEPAFDLVVSTEVVEHLYAPREWAQGMFHCLRPGGRLVCTTPYHGFLKNVAIALTNKYDAHHNPLWDGGHIKFWSPGGVLCPCGVAASPTALAISEADDAGRAFAHRVSLFAVPSGDLLHRVGSMAGSLHTQVHSPAGLRLTRDGRHVVVADSGNARVGVFRVSDGAWVRYVGTGPGPGRPLRCGGGAWGLPGGQRWGGQPGVPP